MKNSVKMMSVALCAVVVAAALIQSHDARAEGNAADAAMATAREIPLAILIQVVAQPGNSIAGAIEKTMAL